MDDQPVGNMTPYGYRKNTTPSIERIAREGMVYEHHYVTGSWTVPTHASLFTGKYQSGHGAGVQFEFLSSEFPTMAEILSAAGYQTVAFSNNTWVNQDETNVARGFERYTLVERPAGQNVQIGPEDDFILDTEEDSGSAYTVRLVQDWFEQEYDASRPFFLFINCVEPHLRAWPPQPFRKRFLMPDVTEDEAREVNQEVFLERMGMVDRPGGYMTPRDWAILKSLKDGETACLDHRMGLLFEYMREHDLLDTTLLIVTSDHGDLLDRPGMMGHHLALFDDLIHTPLIVRFPALIPKGKRFEGFVQICDWLPTVCDMLRIADPRIQSELQGVSLVPTWEGRTVREFVVAEYMKTLQMVERALRRNRDFEYRPWLRRIKILRDKQYKYHWYSDGRDLLFDMEKDPGERDNIIESNPDIAFEMKQKLESFLLSLERRDYGDRMRNHGFRNVNWANVDRVRAWGIYRDVKGREAP
jgi:arylsulfatase A-like enzyme